MMESVYNRDFYITRDRDTEYSAKRILSIVDDLFQLKSAIDIGCGVGTWLRVFKELRGGEAIVAGYDGSYAEEYLVIDKKDFHPVDLEKIISPKSKYDLAISLEVAEHLSKDRAESFVHDLCGFSDVVLFSAATIGQGGDEHINEQRLSYWKNFFEEEDYCCLDIIRGLIWNDNDIPFWYRQNIVIFVKRGVPLRYDSRYLNFGGLSVIHPDPFEHIISRLNTVEHIVGIIQKYINAIELVSQDEIFERYKGKNVIIYGLNEIGKLIFQDFKNYGISVYGVDRNTQIIKGDYQYSEIGMIDADDVYEVLITSAIHFEEIKRICVESKHNITMITRIDDWIDSILGHV